jgi:hypothetical protein
MCVSGAREASRAADAAECLLWSEQMEGFGGPTQPSPTIGQCLNGGYRLLCPEGSLLCQDVPIARQLAASPMRIWNY